MRCESRNEEESEGEWRKGRNANMREGLGRKKVGGDVGGGRRKWVEKEDNEKENAWMSERKRKTVREWVKDDESEWMEDDESEWVDGDESEWGGRQ